ncbi:MAG TPA: ATP-binding protein [Bryobacteraceae bacterium]|nr:ATP-binding protein [Bryobacteraceae bacterium]
MPRAVGSEAGNSGLAYWVGQRLRRGVEALGAEADYLYTRSRNASADERSAWLWRATFGTAIVIGEYLFLYRVLNRRDNPVALGVSWAMLFLLPRPTPRLVLLVARLLVFVTSTTALSSALNAVAEAIPGLRPWNDLIWFLGMAALMIWALSSLRVRRRPVATSQVVPSSPVAASVEIPHVRFRDVGGSSQAKREIDVVAGNRFRRGGHGVVRNGVLLYGPQGTGKNLLAEATAGEFRASFHHVRCPELVSMGIGSTAGEIRRVFDLAAQNRPVVLFLDEVDSVGSRKQPQGVGTDAGGGGREYNAVTTQLMQSIDRYRSLDGLLIMAATNSLDGLEPTLIRDGRFDLKLRLDLPNQAEREAILTSMLKTGSHAAPAIAEISRRTPGWSPARLRALIDRAILQAGGRPVTDDDILAALEESGGKDRPQVEAVNWDDVVLPGPVISDIKAILRLLVPGTAEQLRVPAPTGLVLVGQPGTGKTLVARLIASQAMRSFYAITPSDVLSGVVGGSVKRLAEVFARAREHAPSILFFDEMDALFPAVTGYGSQHDIQLVEQALIEISELRSEHQVFLIGTTNDLSRIDPRILRGGRFSEKIEIGLPDVEGYRRLLEMTFGPTQLASDLTTPRLVEMVRGLSPAEITAVVTAAKRFALARTPEQATALLPIEERDVEQAIARIR